MNYAAFTIGFWHPFGPHGLETPEQIIERKRREIDANGWTLWSFQYRRPQILAEWHSQLSVAGGAPCVFCSVSAGARDPADVGQPVGTTACQSFQFVGEGQWRPCPKGVRARHSFRGSKRRASAFVIERIVYPVEQFLLPHVEWFSEGRWREDRVPTRGEYLIRRGGKVSMRPVRAILELQKPFLAVVSADAATARRFK